LHEGKFREDRPRHGGITEFNQGPTVVLKCIDSPITILVTSKRMVPFSLHQLSSCGLDPTAFRILVAKGVHAPLAAYREVCQRFLRVNTSGSTCADIHQLHYDHRRHPLFPLERDFDPNAL
jgi:microcystin degradation protein MlrC